MFLARLVLAGEHLDFAMVQDGGAKLAVHADIFLVPVVEADRGAAGTLVNGAHAVVEHHGDDAVSVAGVFGPVRLPGGREQRVAFSVRQISDNVEMVNSALDQHRILHGMTEQCAPRHVLTHVRLVAAGDVVDAAELAGAHDAPECGFILIEAMAHRDRHLAASRLDLFGNAHRGRHGVGDRLLAEHIDAVGDRDIDDGLVMVRRHDHGAEIGGHRIERFLRIGEAAAVRQPEDACAISEGSRVDIDESDDLDGAVIDVRAEELAAPALAEAANADMDHALLHHTRPGIGSAGPCVWFHRWPVRLRP